MQAPPYNADPDILDGDSSNKCAAVPSITPACGGQAAQCPVQCADRWGFARGSVLLTVHQLCSVDKKAHFFGLPSLLRVERSRLVGEVGPEVPSSTPRVPFEYHLSQYHVSTRSSGTLGRRYDALTLLLLFGCTEAIPACVCAPL